VTEICVHTSNSRKLFTSSSFNSTVYGNLCNSMTPNS